MTPASRFLLIAPLFFISASKGFLALLNVAKAAFHARARNGRTHLTVSEQAVLQVRALSRTDSNFLL